MMGAGGFIRKPWEFLGGEEMEDDISNDVNGVEFVTEDDVDLNTEVMLFWENLEEEDVFEDVYNEDDDEEDDDEDYVPSDSFEDEDFDEDVANSSSDDSAPELAN